MHYTWFFYPVISYHQLRTKSEQHKEGDELNLVVSIRTFNGKKDERMYALKVEDDFQYVNTILYLKI